MKKIVILLLLAAGMSAQAQTTIGLNGGFNLLGRTAHDPFYYRYGNTSEDSYAYLLAPSLTASKHLNNNLIIGLTAGIVYFRNEYIHTETEEMTHPIDIFTHRITEEKIAWNVGVFGRFDMPIAGNLSLFAQLSVVLGFAYSREGSELLRLEFYDTSVYERHTDGNNFISPFLKATLTPGLSYRFNDHLSADLYLNLMNVAFTYSIVWDDDFVYKTTFRQLSYGTQSLMHDPLHEFDLRMYDYPFLFNNANFPNLSFGINYTF